MSNCGEPFLVGWENSVQIFGLGIGGYRMVVGNLENRKCKGYLMSAGGNLTSNEDKSMHSDSDSLFGPERRDREDLFQSVKSAIPEACLGFGRRFIISSRHLSIHVAAVNCMISTFPIRSGSLGRRCLRLPHGDLTGPSG